MESYLSEQLDRHILWISKDLPELLESLEKKDKIFSMAEINVAFKSQMTSYQIFCFQKYYIDNFCQRDGVLKNYLASQCKLNDDSLLKIQAQIKAIHTGVIDFHSYNKFLGKTTPS